MPCAAVAATATAVRKNDFVGDGRRSASTSRLRPTNVYVRIRPMAESGGHAAAVDENEPSNVASSRRRAKTIKTLERWDESSVTLSTQYLFSKGDATYGFPARVLGPEANQIEAFESMGVPSLVERFANFDRGRNVVMFAYGQTGSGKTHTMLGTDASLRCGGGSSEGSDGGSPRDNPTQKAAAPASGKEQTGGLPRGKAEEEGWGIFPRVYDAARRTMIRSGRPHWFSASAIEFYLGCCSDLLDPSSAAGVHIDPDTHRPRGASVRTLESKEDLLEFLSSVQRNRTTRSTRMNEASSKSGHTGSSRSHAALILTLRQADPVAGSYTQTTFTIMDLAGAERPGKNGEERFTSADMIVWELSRGKEVPTGCQAYLINWELSALATEVRRATEAHRRGTEYAPPRQMATPVTQFLGACFDGQALTAMCLTLSPSNANGWETWYSLQYGAAVSELRVPVRGQKPVDVKNALRRAKKEAAEAEKALRTAPKNRYYESRRIRSVTARRRLDELEEIQSSLIRTERRCGEGGATQMEGMASRENEDSWGSNTHPVPGEDRTLMLFRSVR